MTLKNDFGIDDGTLPKLLWLDLETTGLDPQQDQILEVAAIYASLKDPYSGQVVADHAVKLLNFPRMSEVVWNMHTKNGLIDDLKKATVKLAEIDEFLCKVVATEEKVENRTILAGSTIHFDQGFLKRHMPRIAERLSHRLYDVSAIKLFCQSLGMEKIKKGEAHRALADVKESMQHALTCTKWLSSPAGLRAMQESQRGT